MVFSMAKAIRRRWDLMRGCVYEEATKQVWKAVPGFGDRLYDDPFTSGFLVVKGVSRIQA